MWYRSRFIKTFHFKFFTTFRSVYSFRNLKATRQHRPSTFMQLHQKFYAKWLRPLSRPNKNHIHTLETVPHFNNNINSNVKKTFILTFHSCPHLLNKMLTPAAQNMPQSTDFAARSNLLSSSSISLLTAPNLFWKQKPFTDLKTNQTKCTSYCQI